LTPAVYGVAMLQLRHAAIANKYRQVHMACVLTAAATYSGGSKV